VGSNLIYIWLRKPVPFCEVRTLLYLVPHAGAFAVGLLVGLLCTQTGAGPSWPILLCTAAHLMHRSELSYGFGYGEEEGRLRILDPCSSIVPLQANFVPCTAPLHT
jgi:hypothetical protein